ncbi:MAG: flagellar biosynthesis protein [Planctomycetota bacterium]
MACIPVMLLVSGCATNRGIVDVRITGSQNPTSGPAVKILRVTDKRVFEKAPRVASIPSLKGGGIDDKSITSRAIARKRNTYGKALGDILLPEGRTVENLVREALTKSFREAGYRVIDGAPGLNGKVMPVEADIEQFWAWVTPGFWAVSMEFEAKVNIKGDVPPFKNGETVRGYVELHTQAAGTRAWVNTINKGMEAFVDEVKNRLAQK